MADDEKYVLGKYTVPNKGAGDNDAVCKGSDTNGLQPDFRKAVESLKASKELKGLGYSIVVGARGYMPRSTAQEQSNRGNDAYLRNLSYFGWGLGWQVVKVLKDGEEVSFDVFDSDGQLKSLLNSYGLWGYCYYDKAVLKLAFIKPLDVSFSFSSDVKELSYDGENTSAADACAEQYESKYGDSASSVSGASSSSSGGSSGGSIAAASYFFANQFNAMVDSTEANLLKGVRALANDVPLWDYVKKAVNSSLRACSSDPDGNFIAWYPDYYGLYYDTVTTNIELIELQDLTITQSDKEFYSHVFCPGVTVDGSKMDMLFTQGVVSIETDDAATAQAAESELFETSEASDAVSPLLAKMIYIPEGEEWKYTPKELFRRYGARPAKTNSLPNFQGNVLLEDWDDNSVKKEKDKLKKSSAHNYDSDDSEDDSGEAASESADSGSTPQRILPFLYALYEFMYHWANQYQAKVQVTFMPEVFPGSRISVSLPNGDHISFYVQSVTHNMSYTNGFTTTLGCICPVGNIVPGMAMPKTGE